MDRNPISDLEAVAAMPGLSELADVMVEFLPAGRSTRAEMEAILVFLAGRWAFGSANRCDSAMATTNLWEDLRASAAEVGRALPESPPTFSKLHHLRRVAAGGMADAVAAELTEVAVPLAKSVGLLDPDQGSWFRPAPGNVIHGDGSVFEAMSDVVVDDDGTVHGSRAHVTPRVAPRFEGKGGSDGGSGLPITVVGCHGRKRWQRVVLGVELFRDRDEIGSALRLFSAVIGAAGGGVTHTVYDRLMVGTHMRDIMKMGALPVVAMAEAASNRPHLVLPAVLQRSGFRSAGVREKRKGKGARRRSGDDVAPKSRVAIHHLRTVEHHTPLGPCAHDIWSIDGSAVAVPAGTDVSLDADFLDCRDVHWDERDDGWYPVGRYSVPCRHGSVTFEINFAADRPGKNKNGRPLALADWVRPIPEAAVGASAIEGLRSDSESVFSTWKAMLPRHRAGSLDPNHFLLDVIGAALLTNAVAWDVHVSVHTKCARHEARLAQRRNLRIAA